MTALTALALASLFFLMVLYAVRPATKNGGEK